MNSKQRKSEQNSFVWAVRHGLLPAGEPGALVTREEMADAMYRGLEYFFGEIVAFLEGNIPRNGRENDHADRAGMK